MRCQLSSWVDHQLGIPVTLAGVLLYSQATAPNRPPPWCHLSLLTSLSHRSIILLLLLLLLLHLITHPTKCYTNSKVRALSEKTNSEQVRLQVFRKSRWTNCQVPQFNRQLIPTAGTSNSKGSRTPIRPVARHNKIPTNSGSQSRPTRDCQTLYLLESGLVHVNLYIEGYMVGLGDVS